MDSSSNKIKKIKKEKKVFLSILEVLNGECKTVRWDDLRKEYRERTRKSLTKSLLFEEGFDQAVTFHLNNEVYFIEPDMFLLKPSYEIHQMFCEMKETYLKMVDEMETLKKDVSEGNSAKIELTKLQKKFDGIKQLANEYAKEIEDGNEGNKENEIGN